MLPKCYSVTFVVESHAEGRAVDMPVPPMHTRVKTGWQVCESAGNAQNGEPAEEEYKRT